MRAGECSSVMPWRWRMGGNYHSNSPTLSNGWGWVTKRSSARIEPAGILGNWDWLDSEKRACAAASFYLRRRPNV